MDIGKSFSYVFDDPRWVTKVLIGGVIGLVAVILSYLVLLVIGLLAILPFCVLLGYSAQLMRNVMAGEQYPLPEWSDLGALFKDGAKLFVVGLAYFAPIIVVGLVVGLMGTVLAGNRSTEGAGLGLFILFNCLAALYGLAVWLAFPAITGEYVTTNQISAALRVQEILALVRDNLSDFLVVFLMGIVASFIGGLGIIACGVGLIFTYPYSAFVMSHLWAQVYQKACGGGQQPVVQPPPL